METPKQFRDRSTAYKKSTYEAVMERMNNSSHNVDLRLFFFYARRLLEDLHGKENVMAMPVIINEYDDLFCSDFEELEIVDGKVVYPKATDATLTFINPKTHRKYNEGFVVLELTSEDYEKLGIEEVK